MFRTAGFFFIDIGSSFHSLRAAQEKVTGRWSYGSLALGPTGHWCYGSLVLRAINVLRVIGPTGHWSYGREKILWSWMSRPTPVKIIEKNGRSNAVLGVRTLQNGSNDLNDVHIPKLNTVIVLNDVRSLQEDGTAV